MEVRVRERCGCENGVCARPEWPEFFADEEAQREIEAHRYSGEFSAAADLEMDWFRRRGYLIEDRTGAMHFPPEESPCDDCEGSGYRERWAPLGELVEQIATVDQVPA